MGLILSSLPPMILSLLQPIIAEKRRKEQASSGEGNIIEIIAKIPKKIAIKIPITTQTSGLSSMILSGER
jgi:hypothetical protein